MGYIRKKKIYKLVFEDEEYEGLEVRTTSVPVGIFREIVALVNGDLAKFPELLETFIGVIESWNLEEEDGTPVPVTIESLEAQDIAFVMNLIQAWVEAVSDIPVPLAQQSSNGTPSLEASIPMEPSSPSPAN